MNENERWNPLGAPTDEEVDSEFEALVMDVEEGEDEGLPPPEGFTSLGAAQIVPPQWLIKDMLPAGMCIVGGPPKCGKSTLAAIIALLVNGYADKGWLPPHLSQVDRKGAVWWVHYEAVAGEIRADMKEGLGQDPDDDGGILVADDPWLLRLDDPASCAQMLEQLDTYKPRLFILDPLRNAHTLDEKDSGIIHLLAPFRKWAKKNESCFLLLHHTNKPGQEQERYTAQNLRGTSALFGMVDGLHIVTPLEEGRVTRMKVQAIFKRGQGWDMDLQLSVWNSRGQKSGEVLDDTDRGVLQALSGKPLDRHELKHLTGFGPKVLEDTLLKLTRAGRVVKEGKRWKLKR